MNQVQVAAVREAAAEGIDFDGFEVALEGDAYRVADPDGAERVDGDDLEAALADRAAFVTNWYYWQSEAPTAPDRRAFLRWIEGADDPVPDRYAALEAGVSRTWGQLRITATLGEDGERRYALRHVDDADADPVALEAHDDPREAREIAKLDERDRYRPLKTAPSLRRGWHFPALSGRELVDAVDFFYPATVANWHREREGELDVDHWLETAERQTGIYDVIDELPREAVEWMAEACCVDSQCLRRREWEYEADDELAVDGGDGAFPCREPCSVVIAAARKWAILESEEERTWTLELTTSEKNQLEELIDAVADGRVDEIREADVNDGANRYRARYLRAKRFDDEGDLEGGQEE